MKIFGYEINFARAKKATTKPKKTPVLAYPAASTSQGMPSYTNVSGNTIATYDLIDGLYEKTIMNTIVNKIAGDATRMNYSIQVVDDQGQIVEKIQTEARRIDARVNRKVLRDVIRDSKKYGTAFLFIDYGPDGVPLDMYTVHPQYVEADLVDGVLLGWKYRGGSSAIPLDLTQLIPFPNDAQTGKIFGISAFSPILRTLELFLNSELNTAIIIDKFAIPIIHWMLEGGEEGTIDDSEVLQFMQSMYEQLSVGSDFGTDGRVSSEVVGIGQNIVDFTPILKDLKETFSITVGVPFQLIGGAADNLSATKSQMMSYQSMIIDIQENAADVLIRNVYVPFLESMGYIQGEDYYDIYIDFPVWSYEENSKVAQWMKFAVDYGLITRRQAKNTLGYKGEPLDLDDLDVPMPQIQNGVDVSRPNQTRTERGPDPLDKTDPGSPDD